MNSWTSFFKSIVGLHTLYVVAACGLVVLVNSLSNLFLPADYIAIVNVCVVGILVFTTMGQFMFPAELGMRSSKSYSIRYFETLPFGKGVILASLTLVNLYIISPLLLHLFFFGLKSETLSNGNVAVMIVDCSLFCIGFYLLSFKLALNKKDLRNKGQSLGKVVLVAFKTLALVLFLTLLIDTFPILLDRSGTLFLNSWAFDFKMTHWSLDFFFSTIALLLFVSLILGLFGFVLTTWKNPNLVSWRQKTTKKIMIETSAITAVTVLMSVFVFQNQSDQFRDNDLTSAIMKKDILKVKKLGHLTEYYDKESAFGITPLMAALLVKDCEVYRLLEKNDFKKHGPLVKKSPSDHQVNLLGLAVVAGCTEAIENLLAKEFSIDDPVNEKGWGALHLASENCHPEVAENLLKWGANPNRKDNEGNTPIFYSTSKECYSISLLLKSYKADIQIENKRGEKPIDWLPKNPSRSSTYFFKKMAHRFESQLFTFYNQIEK